MEPWYTKTNASFYTGALMRSRVTRSKIYRVVSWTYRLGSVGSENPCDDLHLLYLGRIVGNRFVPATRRRVTNVGKGEWYENIKPTERLKNADVLHS